MIDLQKGMNRETFGQFRVIYYQAIRLFCHYYWIHQDEIGD